MKRPKMIWFNGLLTLFVIGLLCFTKIPLYGAFMIGLAVALIINFHSAKEQARAIKMHAATALTMPMILLASGVFLGVLSKTGMMKAMAQMLIAIVPAALGPHLQDVFGFFAGAFRHDAGDRLLLLRSAASGYRRWSTVRR